MYALTLTSFKTTTLVVAWTVRCETRFFIIANRVSVRVFSERPTNLHLPRKSLCKKRKTGIRQGQIPVFVLYQRIVASDDNAKVRIFPFPPNCCYESSGNLCSVYFQNTKGHIMSNKYYNCLERIGTKYFELKCSFEQYPCECCPFRKNAYICIVKRLRSLILHM